MDYETNPDRGMSSHEPTSEPIRPIAQRRMPTEKKGGAWKVILIVVLILSLLANGFLFLMLIGLGAFVATGYAPQGHYLETVVRAGDTGNKIAVIRLEGIIDSEQSASVRKQIKAAREDHNVRGVIVRTVSPGGTVSSSDRIYHEISTFREETGMPAVAFMQTVAASGGYYTSVACDQIVAEPTVITGSIGVVANHMVIRQLLEVKLGITPVVWKSGEKKDWPSLFSETTDQQRQYLMDKLINPAYERFVSLVIDGRENLTEEEVRRLADGSIYFADEAVEVGLIDRTGYMDEAIGVAEALAGIQGAHVIEYVEPFSFSNFLRAKQSGILNLNENTVRSMMVPKLMYLWTGGW